MRFPNLRAGLYLLVVGLMPFVWLVETSGCGNDSVPTIERSGVDVVLGEQHNFEAFEIAIVFAALAIAAMSPWVAQRLKNRWLPLVLHVLGLAATLLVAWGMWLLIFFSIFTTRTLRVPGMLATAAIVATVGDAFVRLGGAVRTLWRNRKAPLPEIASEGSKPS